MRIKVKVTPNANKNELVEIGPNNYKAKITAPAEGNRANLKLMRMLSEKFKVPTSKIRITRGARDRNKVVEIVLL